MDHPEVLELLNGSNETEHLKCKRYGMYRIISYKKSQLYPTKDQVDSFGQFRSVIVNNKNNVVCVSPAKSIPENLVDQNFSAEEFVEGTMINVFFDHELNQWEIATRGTVGGHARFYTHSGSFKELFFDACEQNNFQLDMLPTEYCYSFVLQHPENQFVKFVGHPKLYLVDVFELVDGKYKYVSFYRKFHFVPKSIRYPRLYKEKSLEDLKELYANPVKTNYDVMGFVLKNHATGDRYKCRNPNHSYAISLKENQPNEFLLYRSLCQKKKFREFLSYFPHSRAKFDDFHYYVAFVQQKMLESYYSCFVHKTAQLSDFYNPVKNSLYHLHKIYLEQLKPNKLHITMDDIKLFFYSMDEKTYLRFFYGNGSPNEAVFNLKPDKHEDDYDEDQDDTM
jgi:hypothetical protein